MIYRSMKKMKKAGFLIGVGLMLVQTAPAQNLKDALKFTENHQFEEASKVFRKLIAEKPTDATNYYYMGENMYKSERFDSAAFYYEKGISVDANVALNHVGKGKIALTKNDEATAKPLFQKALTLSQDAKVYIAVAEAYISNEWKSMTYALECLANAEKADRNNPNIYLLMGDAALIGTNDGLTALNNYEKARDMDPKNPKPYIHIGTLYERARSYDLALVEYNKAVSLDTTFAPSYYKLGDLYYQFGDFKNAKDYMLKYVKLAKSLSSKIKYAKYLFLAKEYESAIFEMDDINTVDSSLNILNRLLAYSYFETKDCAKALQYMEKFLRKAQTTGDKIIADDHRYYGKILLCAKKDSLGATLAIPELKMAIDMDSSKLDVYGSLADAYLKVKSYDDAVNILLQKFTLVKEPAINDIFKIGQAYYVKAVDTKDSLTFLKADSTFAIVTAQKPDLVVAHVFRARTNAGLDPLTKSGLAKPHYEKVIEFGTLDAAKNKVFLAEAHYYLAYIFFQAGNKADALKNVDKTLEYDPAYKGAPELKKKIEKMP